MKLNNIIFIILIIALCSCVTNNKKANNHFKQSKIFYENNDFYNALQEVDSALLLDTSSLDAKVLKARIQSKLNLNEEAIAVLLSILKDKYKSDTVNYLIGYCYFGIASNYFSQSDKEIRENEAYENSIKYTDLALKYNPSYFSAYIQKAKILHNLERYDEALISLNKAESFFPDSMSIKLSKGVEKHFLGDNSGALNDINSAIHSNKLDSIDFSDAYRFRALIYSDKDSIDLAISDLTSAINYNPTNEYAYLGRASLYRMKQMKEKACSDYRKAADLGYIAIYETIKSYCE